MKILFITSKKPEYQAEYLELTVLNGLRKILGENLVDYPRKKVAYGDFTEIDKMNALFNQVDSFIDSLH